MSRRLLALLGLLACMAGGTAQAGGSLFSSHDILDLTIPLDFKTLCRPREDPDCDYTPTRLEFIGPQGLLQSIPIEVKVRGGWRALTRNCSVPLLWVRFDPQTTAGTPFEGQRTLPLTTHCGQGLSLDAAQTRVTAAQWELYLLKEYLAHRLYNEISDLSIRARLIRITYPNPRKPNRRIVNFAFFTEHFRSVATRNDGELLERRSFDAEKTDLEAANRLALFQFMIGNTDWSIARERNIALVLATDGSQHPLPFDFDMSGLVNAHYAGPAPRLPINEVTDRYYLGFCDPDADWDELFATFLDRQEQLLTLVDETPELGKNTIRSSQRFLRKFFDILQSEPERTQMIIEHCQAWPPGPDDHTTPLN